jgi:uroporphyrin-III C-methyltransferase/precorrin-2 dehydrogenase/sirohydrochlorin ferrochelatase
VPEARQNAAQKLNAFPVFMRVEGEVVVIVGGGDEALAKARLIAQSSARIRVVAEHVEPALAAWLADTGAELVASPYDASQLNGARLVFAASGGEALDRRVSEDARRLGLNGQRRRPPGTLRFLHAGAGQPRAGLRGHRHGRRGPCPGAA